MMVYGRGLQMIELYVSPSTMDSQLWQIVGEATRWGQENQGVLGKSVMVGGDPNRGEVYGYAHWKGDRGILCLRNPDVREQAVGVPFGQVGLPPRGDGPAVSRPRRLSLRRRSACAI